ncbi:MAG: VOC family protein [Jiangellaceae bacterium]|nr:VOC family protein [Jiangellaceae bacterium]
MPKPDLVGVIVSDLARAVAFYRRLGIAFSDDPGAESDGHVEVTLPGGLRFAIDTEDTIRSFDPSWSPPSGGHRIAVAFRCDSPEDVDQTYRDLLQAGGTAYKQPWDAFWGQRYAQLRDPDGNVVDLFAPLARGG